jgi:biotin carboxyl carrier protein
MHYEIEVNGRPRRVDVHRADGRFTVRVDDRTWSIDASRVDPLTLSLLMSDATAFGSEAAGGTSHEVTLAPDAGAATLTVCVGAVALTVSLDGKRRRARRDDGDPKAGPQRLAAPMPGKVVRVLVEPGEKVRAGQPIVVIEAMKMENELRSGRAGRVTDVAVRSGQSVEAGVLLAVIADS